MSDEKRVVHLWETEGAFIIVEAPTGIIYSNQVGGTACGHPEVEGFLVPVDRYADMDEIKNITRDYWHNGSLKQLSNADMKRLAKAVQELTVVVGGGLSKTTSFCVLGGDHLDMRCGEAWVPVKTIWGPGWLTWENSD